MVKLERKQEVTVKHKWGERLGRIRHSQRLWEPVASHSSVWWKLHRFLFVELCIYVLSIFWCIHNFFLQWKITEYNNHICTPFNYTMFKLFHLSSVFSKSSIHNEFSRGHSASLVFTDKQILVLPSLQVMQLKSNKVEWFIQSHSDFIQKVTWEKLLLPLFKNKANSIFHKHIWRFPRVVSVTLRAPGLSLHPLASNYLHI